MNRVVEGEYSCIPLHLMVESARAVGVPFKEWIGKERAFQLEPLSAKKPVFDLEALDQHWAQAAIEQGGPRVWLISYSRKAIGNYAVTICIIVPAIKVLLIQPIPISTRSR